MKLTIISRMGNRERQYDDPQAPPVLTTARALALFESVIVPALQVVEIWNASPVVTLEQGADRRWAIQALRGASHEWGRSEQGDDVEAQARRLLAEPMVGGVPSECQITALLAQAVQRASQQRPGGAARCLAVALVLETWIPGDTELSLPISAYTQRTALPLDLMLCSLFGELSDLAGVVNPLGLIDRIEEAKAAIAETHRLTNPLDELSTEWPEANDLGAWGSNVYHLQTLIHKVFSGDAAAQSVDDRCLWVQIYGGLECAAALLNTWSLGPTQDAWPPEDLSFRDLISLELETTLLQAIRLAHRLERNREMAEAGEVAAVARRLRRLCLHEMEQLGLIPQPPQVRGGKENHTSLEVLLKAIWVSGTDAAWFLNSVLIAVRTWEAMTPGVPEKQEVSWPPPQWMLVRDIALYGCLYVLLTIQFSAQVTPGFSARASKALIPSAAEIREAASELLRPIRPLATVHVEDDQPSRSPAEWWQVAHEALWKALLCPLASAARPDCHQLDSALGHALEGLADALEKQRGAL